MQAEVINNAGSKNFGRTYRDFSRKRYAQLKNAPGKQMREPQIIQKIIREWDELQNANKTRRASNRNELNTPLKMEPTFMNIEKKNQNLLKSTSAKKEDDINEERSSFEQELKNIEVMPFDSEDKPAKTKAIKKERIVSSYIEFFKLHYERLMAQHPYWSNNQATIIIKLMWKKEKLRSRVQKPKMMRMTMKKRSGRMAYKNIKAKEGLDNGQIMMKWKHLPRQSKKIWEVKGNPSISESKMMPKTIMVVRNQHKNIKQMLQKRML